MSIDNNLFLAILLLALLLAGTLAYLYFKQRKQLMEAEKKTAGTSATSGPAGQPASLHGTSLGAGFHTDATGIPTRQLQLQAYERLILLTDRIAMPNLIQRVNQPGLSVQDMQSLLTYSIRQEFEHNITQQIYVSPEAWDAVRNLKEQNLLIINQVASFMPAEAGGTDLNRHLLDLLVQNPKASLQNVVAEALSYEAKKIM
jgi:hypothetical protein